MEFSNEEKTTDFISFTFDEIKPLILKYIEEAHNVNGLLYLPKCITYEEWHYVLQKFYKSNKNKKPSKSDYLAFIILLSYPRNILEKITEISDLKLFQDNNSDFIFKERKEQTSEQHNQDNTFNMEQHDCICSYEKLQNVYLVENKYSGITLQVGSKCIMRYKIISNEELKKFKTSEKKRQERQKEIKEEKPIGFYEEERRYKKEQKEQQKRIKEIEKQEKESIKEIERERKEYQDKLNSCNYKRCMLCNENLVNIRQTNTIVCNSCKLDCNYKELVCKNIKMWGFIECENCNENFLDIRQSNTYLCRNCRIDNKIVKCCMFNCLTHMIVDLSSMNVFCDDCQIKNVKCIDCKNIFIQKYTEIRCNSCQYNYQYKYVNKVCIRCEKDIIVKETESWKTHCKECYKEIQDIKKEKPKCKCELLMVEKLVKKEGKNKGRKALTCSQYPNGCNMFTML
jgi:hypothetical protein